MDIGTFLLYTYMCVITHTHAFTYSCIATIVHNICNGIYKCIYMRIQWKLKYIYTPILPYMHIL